MPRKAPIFLVALMMIACETKDPCDGIDNDGDGYYDEDRDYGEVLRPFFTDVDGDGFGDGDFVVEPPVFACAPPEDRVSNNFDCDDADAQVHPDAMETCNDIDDNCDGTVDENAGNTYWSDADADGYGDPESYVVACEQPAAAVDNSDDCDDTDGGRYPGNAEICDGIDNDCDGDLPADEEDGDGDGFLACEDCDDAAAAVFPGAFEICDGVDSNCDGAVDDADNDNSGTADCSEALVLVSGPFAAGTAICAGTGLTYWETELAAIEAAAADVGLGAVSVAESDTEGISLDALSERPVVVLLNGGLPWADPFFDDTLPALEAAFEVGIPLYVLGDDAADGVDDYTPLSGLIGLIDRQDSGAADSVNILQATHPVTHGAHGDVIGFWSEADMDVTSLREHAELIAEQSANGAPALVVIEDAAGTRTAVQLFAAAASHDTCPQVPADRAEPLARNAILWLLE